MLWKYYMTCIEILYDYKVLKYNIAEVHKSVLKVKM